MKKNKVLLSILSLGFLLAGCNGTSETYADTVIYGKIYTSDDSNAVKEAMAIKDGKIMETGTKEEIAKVVGQKTVTKNKEFVMPGFIDGHTHIYVQAENQQGFILTGKEATEGNKYDGYLAVIREYVKANPNMEVYKGFGWLDSAFIGGTPTAAMLDEICADKPIYIKSEDCHSAWVNTKMMNLAKITVDTPNPVGGVIEHDDKGNPNGCFRDTAMDYLIKPYVPLYSVEDYQSMLLWAQRHMLNNGYTAYDDVIIDPQSADNICHAYHKLDQEGKLKAKINVAILINNTEDYLAKLDEVVKMKAKYDGTHFHITDVKIFMDGIVESETAYVSLPYTDGKTGADRWTGDESTNRLYDLTKNINDEGLVAHFHAIGDAAISKALDAIEYARKNSVNKNIRNCITHLQMITKEQIQRMASLDVIAAANLGWAPSVSPEAGSTNIEELNVGEERNNAMYPFKTMLDSGVKMSYATDYPAGPVDYPFYNIQAGVTRQILNMTSTLRNAKECLTIDQALHVMTSGGAYQLGMENQIGTLEKGKEADFIILNDDIASLPTSEIFTSVSLDDVYIAGQSLSNQ